MLNQIIYLLTINCTSYVWCTLAPEKGENWHRWRKDHTEQFDEKWCVPPYGALEGGAGPFRGVMALGYLRCSDWVPYNTSSQIWGGWYFPRFMLRGGSFTLMNMASLIVLVMPCSSYLLWWNSLHWLGVLCSSCVGKWGMGLWGVPLAYPQKVLPDYPVYSSRQSTWGHWNWYITPLF